MKPIIQQALGLAQTISGWWLSHPSEKIYKSHLGILGMIIPNWMESHKSHVPVTTKQIGSLKMVPSSVIKPVLMGKSTEHAGFFIAMSTGGSTHTNMKKICLARSISPYPTPKKSNLTQSTDGFCPMFCWTSPSWGHVFTKNWLMVGQPLWKMMEFVRWDDDIPNWMGK